MSDEDLECPDCDDSFPKQSALSAHHRYNHPEKSLWDIEEMERLYCEEGMSAAQVGNELGHTGDQVLYQLKKHDIERRGCEGPGGPWRDPEMLEEYYHEKGWSLYDMADEWGCGPMTVHNNMKKHGIERNGVGNPSNAHLSPATFLLNKGYEQWHGYSRYKKNEQVSVH